MEADVIGKGKKKPDHFEMDTDDKRKGKNMPDHFEMDADVKGEGKKRPDHFEMDTEDKREGKNMPDHFEMDADVKGKGKKKPDHFEMDTDDKRKVKNMPDHFEMDTDDKGKQMLVLHGMHTEEPGITAADLSSNLLAVSTGRYKAQRIVRQAEKIARQARRIANLKRIHVETESNPSKGSSMPGPGAVAKKQVVVETSERLSFTYDGKPLLRLNYLFPCEYEIFENDLQFLWGLLGGLHLQTATQNLLFQPSRIDHSSGITMYRLDKTAVNHFQIIGDGLEKNDFGLNERYLRIDDLGTSIPKKAQHVSVCGNIDSSVLKNLYQTKALQTLLILRQNGPRMDCLPSDLFKELPSLQVLDLSHTNIAELPSSIRDATQLRYLNLSYTSVVELPNSLCNILTLETLKLRGLKLRRLPKAIRRLTSLKHLDVDASVLLISMPPGVGDLKHLHTLPAFVVRKKHGWRVTELKNLVDLQNLCILRLENLSSPEEAKEAALHKKYFLKKLEFHWSRLEDGLEVFESFRPTSYIKELHIVGYGGASFPRWVGDPSFSFLETIAIHNCIKCDVLPTLGRLSSLKFLRISHMDEVKIIDEQFIGKHIAYSGDPAFPMLKQLTFNKMPELNEWIGVEEGDFPSLQNLNIAGCSKLKSLPELFFFQSLNQLEISLCPSLESFPENGLSASLQSIVIIECPLLKERCKKDVGEDWVKLSHIPNIWINYQLISTDRAPQLP